MFQFLKTLRCANSYNNNEINKLVLQYLLHSIISPNSHHLLLGPPLTQSDVCMISRKDKFKEYKSLKDVSINRGKRLGKGLSEIIGVQWNH